MDAHVPQAAPRRSGFACNSDARGGSVKLCYEEFGSQADPGVLLIMGRGAQMLGWPTRFCELIAAAGFRVVRYDNRDVGESTRLSGGKPRPLLVSAARNYLGRPGKPSCGYDLVDMAQDAVALLDHLDIGKAHVVGKSLGGMIGQILAAEHPERTASFTAVATSANLPFVFPFRLALLPLLFRRPKPGETREQVIDRLASTFQAISGSFPLDEMELRSSFAARLDRGEGDGAGMARHNDAMFGTGSLAKYAKRISCPTTVVHGDADPLIRPACGKDLAGLIPGARLRVIPGMGHSLPEAVWGVLLDELTQNVARAHADRAADTEGCADWVDDSEPRDAARGFRGRQS